MSVGGEWEFGRSSGSERSTGTTEDARERLLEGARGVAGTVGRTRRAFGRVARCAARGDVDATDLVVTPLANWTPELLSEPVSVPERAYRYCTLGLLNLNQGHVSGLSNRNTYSSSDSSRLIQTLERLAVLGRFDDTSPPTSRASPVVMSATAAAHQWGAVSGFARPARAVRPPRRALAVSRASPRPRARLAARGEADF